MVDAISPVVVPGPADLAEAAARWTADHLRAAVAQRGACYWALAGGETPRGCYERLARPPYRDSLPWGSVFAYWSDERQVPLDDPASNYAMAKAALLEHVPIPPDHVFPLIGDPTPALLRIPADASGRPRFDVIHLGLGEDGH
ncbi:MAG TPA: 6-phosphogluconolactonase, partial [Candidatus Dormibacteraeota bacterium]|nr:6-phosphogluconolactonase [Candidatus Dormibacteraeota bacterium]